MMMCRWLFEINRLCWWFCWRLLLLLCRHCSSLYCCRSWHHCCITVCRGRGSVVAVIGSMIFLMQQSLSFLIGHGCWRHCCRHHSSPCCSRFSIQQSLMMILIHLMTTPNTSTSAPNVTGSDSDRLPLMNQRSLRRLDSTLNWRRGYFGEGCKTRSPAGRAIIAAAVIGCICGGGSCGGRWWSTDVL